MRISTTSLIIICTVLFFGASFNALGQTAGQVPEFSVDKIQHTCGPVGTATGSFMIHLTAADPNKASLTVTIIAGVPLPSVTISPVPSTFPQDYPVTGLTGAIAGKTYIVVVSDDTNSNTPSNGFPQVWNFSVAPGVVTNNTKADCTPPDGSITVNLTGNSSPTTRPIVYSWAGPAGFVDPHTKDISGLKGGDYTLTYSDSNTPPTSCVLGPIHITDPAAADFGITGPANICVGSGLSVVVTATTLGYTYDVMEGPTIIATKPGDGTSNMPIPVPAAPMTLGSHSLTVRASQGTCSPKFNSLPDLTVNVNPTPTYNDFTAPANVCSSVGIGINLNVAKAGGLNATSFNIASPIVSNGMTSTNAVTGNVLFGDLADDVWRNVSNSTQAVVYTITPTINSCPGASFKITVMIDPQPDFNDLVPAPGVCSGIAIGVTLDGQRKGTSVLAASYNITAINPHGMTRVGGTSAVGPATNISISGDKWQNTTNAIVNADYTIKPISGANCVGDPFTISVPITPQPDYSGFTSPTLVCSQAVTGLDLTGHESPGSLAATSFTVTQITLNGATLVGGSPAPGAVPFAITATDLGDDQWKNITNANVNVDYKIIPTVGGCSGSVFTVSVTIIPEPDYNNGNPSICSDLATGVNLDSFAKGTSVLATAYDIALVTPDPTLTPKVVPAMPRNDRTATEIANDQWENLTGTPKPVVYDVIPKNGTCVGTLFKVTIMVTPEPDVTDYNSAPGGVCSGDVIGLDLSTLAVPGSVAASSYKINSIVATSLTVLPGSSAAGDIGPSTIITNDKYTNNTSGALPVTYNITPRNGTCDGDPFSVIVLIVPRPSYADFSNLAGICATPLGIDLASLKNPGSPDATLFTIQTISFPSLTKVGAPLAPFPITGLSSTAIANDIWSNTTAANHDVDYSIIPLNGTCAGNLFHVIFTIKPQPDYLSIPTTVCSNVAVGLDLNTAKNAPSAIADAFTVTNINIPVDPNFAVAVGPAALNVPLTSSAIAADVWKNTSNGPLDVVYTIVPQLGTCQGAQFMITVTVNPEPVYSNKALPDVCSEDVIGFDLELRKAAISVSATTFTFTTLASGTLTAIGPTTTTGSGNNMIIADDQWRNVTNGSIDLVYTITPGSVDNCDGVPFTITVKINPQPDYNDYNNNNAPGGMCADPLAIDVSLLKKLTSIAATSFDITLITFDPTKLTQIGGTGTPDDLSDDVWHNGSATNQDVAYQVVPSVGGCDGNFFTVTVTILPSPDYNDFSNTICSKDPVGVDFATLKKPASITATTFAITDNGPGIPVVSTDPNAISDDVWTNTTTTAVIVKYTIIPKQGTCSGAAFFVTITVNPEPFAPPIAKTICTGNKVSLDLQTGAIDLGNAIALTTFEWTVANNTNVTGEAVGLQTTATIDDLLVNATALPEDVIYTVTPTSPNGCVGAPFTVTVTVSPRPVLVVGQAKTICSGTGVGYEILLNPANLPAGTTFTWPAPTMSDGSIQGTAQTNVAMGPAGTLHINDVLVNPNAGTITANYIVTPSIGGACAGTPQSILITINQAFIANAGADQTICTDNGPYTLVGSSVSGAATTGTWSVVSFPLVHDEVVLPLLTPLATPSMATFTATEPGDYVLRLQTNPDPSAVCQPGIDFVTITVTPKPVIAPLQAKTICGNDPVAYEILLTPAGLPLNTVFDWADPDGPSGLNNATASPPGGVAMGAPGTLHLNDVLRNDGTTNVDVIYQVTPSVGICIGAMQDIVITVRPSPVVVFGQTKTICSGDRVDYEIMLAPANLPANTTFSWPDPDGAGSGTSQLNVPADPAGTFHITDTLFNGSGAPKHVIYQVISTGSNGCKGVTRDVDIVVNSGAIADAGNAQSICSNGTATLTGSSVGGLATTGTWTVFDNAGGLGDGVIANGTATATPDLATFKASIGGVYKLQLITDDPAGSCNAVSDFVVITVKSPGDPSCTGGSGTCSNVSIAPIPTPATCSNSDGSVLFDIIPAVPIAGDVTITIDGTGSTVLPSPRTNVNNFTFSVLAVGTYSYTILYGDASCTKTGFFAIDRSGTIGTATVSNLVDPVCFGATGTATIDVPGETGNILQWSANGIDFNNFLVGNPVNGLPAGLISVQRPGDPCAAGVMVNFTMPAEIPVTLTPVSATCNGTDGMVEVANNTGGTAPYVFEVNGVQTIPTADNIFHGLTAGNYDFVVKDAQGCSKTYATITVGQIVGPGTLDTLYVKKGISVPDLPSGSALVGVSPSGLEPYETRLELIQPLFATQSYLADWTEVPLNPQNLKFEQSYTNIFAGVYSLGLRDAGGCTKLYVVSINVDTQLFIPNIFTPNGDDHNEVFYIRNLPVESKLLITNRWGKEVFKSSSYQNDWNGGDTVDGMYYYTLKVSGKAFTGWIEILRGQ